MKRQRVVGLLALLVSGCLPPAREPEPKSSVSSVAPVPEGATRQSVARPMKVWIKAKMKTVDLRPLGMELVIDVPDGCTVQVEPPDRFSIYAGPNDRLLTATRTNKDKREDFNKEVPGTKIVGGNNSAPYYHASVVGGRVYLFAGVLGPDAKDEAARLVEIARSLRAPSP